MNQIQITQDPNKIDFGNPAIQLHLQSAKQKVILKIQVIVLDVMTKNKENLELKSSPEVAIARMKEMATMFMDEQLHKEKMERLAAISPRIKEIVSRVATLAGSDLMQSPMRGFLGLLSANTSLEQLTNFFLIHSIGPSEEFEKIVSP